MIETYENIFQIAVLAACFAFSVYKAASFRSRTWMLLVFFYGSWMLGEIYWLACLIFFDQTPQISVISDLSWYAANVFLYILLGHVWPPEELGKISPVSWLGPVFAAGMAVFFMFWGEIISNLIYAGLMGLLLFSAVRRMTDADKTGRNLFLPVWVLVYVLLLYRMWISSCFWNDAADFQVYYVFDFLLTISFPFFLPATRKAVTV